MEPDPLLSPHGSVLHQVINRGIWILIYVWPLHIQLMHSTVYKQLGNDVHFTAECVYNRQPLILVNAFTNSHMPVNVKGMKPLESQIP